MNFPLPFQSNVHARFTIAHNYLTQKLLEKNGVLKKADIKMLQNVVNNYVAFRADESNYRSSSTDGVFFLYNMSTNDFKSKNVGDSEIVFHNLLSLDYKLDLTNKNSNTLNKIISKSDSNASLVQLCKLIRDELIPGHINRVGTTIPSKPRIVIATNGNVRLMVVFFMNKCNKMRVLIAGAS